MFVLFPFYLKWNTFYKTADKYNVFKTGVLAIIGLHGGPYSLHLKISVPKS